MTELDQRAQRLVEDLLVGVHLASGRGGAHQGHVVKGRQEHAAVHAVQVQEVLEERVEKVTCRWCSASGDKIAVEADAEPA